ncbi:glucagon family neuropeptides-like isoform X4 [Carassius auratus]|uniref:Glucagon family neuropeptides-like isoform X4 n=1 Tax=Carassius auratus TaxID=7957 RepID=A0A6P6KH59_CARAU|nr:glucagon family neuropeptides-like isoform X4 [Carassius auratus]
MMTSSKTTLAFLIYGLLVQCHVCSPLTYPSIRMETAGFNEEGHSLTDLTFDSDQISIRSSPSVTEDALTLYSPPSKRGGSTMEDDTEPLSKRHSDGVFTDSYSHYRKQMAVKKYLAAVLGKRYRQRYRSRGRRLACL